MIEVKGLVKDYGTFRAVDNISFTVPKGQVLGFLGPNGAGKSTTMEMLTCFLEPSAGTATVGGYDICSDSLAVRQLIGYLPESAPSYAEMTVHEFLDFVAEIRGIHGSERQRALSAMREQCFLEAVWHKPIENLSKGYRQRVGFAQALIHDPPVLVLDEPTDGLDPNQKQEVRSLIKRMASNKTIILSTHILEEVEAVCQRAIIIANGKIVADATPEELMERSRLHNAVTIRFGDGDLEAARRELGAIQQVDHIELVESTNALRLFPRERQSIIDPVSSAVRDKSWNVAEMYVEQGRLDEVFRDVTIGRSGS